MSEKSCDDCGKYDGCATNDTKTKCDDLSSWEPIKTLPDNINLLDDALGRACELIGHTFDCPFSYNGNEFDENCSDQCGETGEKTRQCWIRYFKGIK